MSQPLKSIIVAPKDLCFSLRTVLLRTFIFENPFSKIKWDRVLPLLSFHKRVPLFRRHKAPLLDKTWHVPPTAQPKRKRMECVMVADITTLAGEKGNLKSSRSYWEFPSVMHSPIRSSQGKFSASLRRAILCL